MFKIYKEADYDAMSRRAANIIASQITLKPTAVLGLATGGTPVGIYKHLITKYQQGDLDFSKITTVNLDEYRGLNEENPQSYRYFMDSNLFQHINIDKSKTHVPNGLAADHHAECSRYDLLIHKLGGVDLQLLGIGNNGHIAFNEPTDYFPAGTHCVKLKEETILANARFFERKEDVPTEAFTMGIGTIFKAKKIILVANGLGKAKILKEALLGKVTPEVPASILQFHPDVTIVGDEESMSLL